MKATGSQDNQVSVIIYNCLMMSVEIDLAIKCFVFSLYHDLIDNVVIIVALTVGKLKRS